MNDVVTYLLKSFGLLMFNGAAGTEAYALEAAQPVLEPIRIIVADDHPVFRDALCQLLATEQGLQVLAQAHDGREVLELLERLQPDILLLDLNMPGMDGRAVLQQLRDRRLRTRVIVLTASNDREDLQQAMQLGASGVVLKEDRTAVLIKSIRRVHAGEIWVNPSTTATVMRPPAESVLPVRPAPPWRTQYALTFKEAEVVRLVARGLRNKDIATRMTISEQTVKNHLRNIFDKLRVDDRLELALFAIHHGIAE